MAFEDFALEAQFQAAEILLRDRFPQMVGSISLLEVAERMPGYRRPTSLEDYVLVPISATGAWHDTQYPADLDWTPHGDVEVVAEHDGGVHAYLETSRAIGLGYKSDETPKPLLLAIAAGAAHPGRVRVQQLQGTIRDRLHPIARQGLRGGLLWPHTLVGAWAAVGAMVGSPAIEVRSAQNNVYLNDKGGEVLARGLKRYDGTAHDLGFVQDEETKNWFKDL